ncbi:hypothetical protein BaRGS_00020519, partial [Batillaria attramentaria]
MDPFRHEKNAIYETPLESLTTEEHQALNCTLAGVLHVLPKHCLTRKRFKGTLFWFPLREAPSELSGTVYNQERVRQLKQALRSEVSVLPLFLKRMEKIEVYSGHGESHTNPTLDFSASLTDDCLQAVQKERKRFIAGITTADKLCPTKQVSEASFLDVETCVREDGGIRVTRDQWMVVNFHHGLDDMSPELRILCQRHCLTYRPYVGVAAKLHNPTEVFQGQLFCFLPLPPEKVSPMGLPVHVNGFFELSQNRRQVKWPSTGQEEEPAMSDDALQWNQLLVSEVLPLAYVTLISEVIEKGMPQAGSQSVFSRSASFCPQPSQVHELSHQPDLVYGICPNPKRVTYHWEPLLQTFYQQFAGRDFFFTRVRGGNWLALQDGVLMTPRDGEADGAMLAVTRVYEACEENLVKLPHHVICGLQDAFKEDWTSRHLPGSTDRHFEVVSPEHLSNMMRGDTRWQDLSADDKRLVLYYLCSQDDLSTLDDLQLIPLANGTFSTFPTPVHVCRDLRDLELLPGLEDRLCFVTQPEGLHDLLLQLAHDGRIGMKPVDDAVFPKLLQQSIRTTFRSRTALLPLQDRWIRLVWHYLQDKSLTEYDHLPLLPCVQEDQLELRPLQGNYICEKLPGFPSASPALSRALRHLGITVITSLPDVVLHHDEVPHTRVQPASHMGLVKCMSKLIADCSSTTVKDIADRFNNTANVEERNALVQCLSVEQSALEGVPESEWNTARDFLRCLQLFPAWPPCRRDVGEGRHVAESQPDVYICVCEENQMTPEVGSYDLPPPVSFAPRLLNCSSNSHRQLAERLGAREKPVTNVYREMLTTLATGADSDIPRDEVIQFMSFFLQSQLFADAELKTLAKQISFVACAQSEDLKRPDELYDPGDELLLELFHLENRFPQKSSDVGNLRQLELRGGSSVLASHLIETAKCIDRFCQNDDSREAALRKSHALWRFLKKFGGRLAQETIDELSDLRCLPCVSAESERPTDYPKSVPLCPEPYTKLAAARPSEMNNFSDLHVVGSIRPVAVEEIDITLPHVPLAPACPEDVLAHLEMVIFKFNKTETRQFSAILHLIYARLNSCLALGDVLGRLCGMRCILNERDGTFYQPSEFWAQENADDLDLKPYRFPLPTSLREGLQDFFLSCGCRQRQDSAMLNDVLQDIKYKYDQTPCDKADYSRDFRLVVNILETLKTNADFKHGEVLLPVYTTRENTLILRPARECTVAPDPQTIELLSEEEGLVFVHPDLHKHKDVVFCLGADDLRSKTLSGMEPLGADDEEYGQKEKLTTRLRNLLLEGYTDGFCVPKELLQNADDAGARVVKLLLDERENPDWRSGLITPELSSLQGPAIWAYNDAMFTDADFANICKLGGATKKEDSSKVGRFGLGFNAVYNLTEVPTVYSGTTMAMLDPHETYLEGKRGKKMNFNNLMNKVLLKRMPNQFRPFQGIFGCDILNSDNKPFQGTLFRFPLRTEAQAERSEICKEAFSKHKQDEFVQSLMSKAGNLMLFLQSVQRLELYRLTKDCKEPSQATRLVVVERTSESDFRIDHSSSILGHFSSQWKETVQQNVTASSQMVVERVRITVEKSNKEKEDDCMFNVAWAMGVGEACDIARGQREEGFVPLAAIAVPVDPQGSVLPVADCAEGFYRTGHLFCFLPLAKEASTSCLPVHINAPFALTSDRRGLLTQTEDDNRQLLGAQWNTALFKDAIPRAYLTSLEQQGKTHNDSDIYYSIWPKHSSQMTQEQNFYTHLIRQFYTVLVTEDYKVFPHEDGWVAFSSAWFFDPKFKETDVGRVAFGVLQKFWSETKWKASGVLVDVPHSIVQNIRDAGQRDALQQREITEVEFFTEVLFPRLSGEEESALDVHDRNLLVLHALVSDNEQLQDLVKSHPCIPCQPDGVLKLPSQLVHPKGAAASLFTVDDARFPQKADGADFCRPDVLTRLVNMGMVEDKLPNKEVMERAQSVEKIANTDMSTAVQRAVALVRYLSPDNLGQDLQSVTLTLSEVKFLPVLPKPTNWPFPWHGDGEKFVAPCEAFGSSLKDLVACQAYILDDVSKATLGLQQHESTLQSLGVTVYKARGGTKLVQTVMAQLITISRSVTELTKQPTRLVGTVTTEIYKFLNRSCEDSKGVGSSSLLQPGTFELLKDEAVVWTKFGFQEAHRVAFSCTPDCSPYLIALDSHTAQNGRRFFGQLGVKERFDTEDALGALERIRIDKGSSALSTEDVTCVTYVAALLSSVLGKEKLDETRAQRVHLPDRHGWLRPVSELCLDDCDWVTESASMKFLHPKVSPFLASVFGVRTKREHDEDDFTESFGQQEQLTNRINRLLDGYTRDEAIFKELLQNADDAGATEVWFVKDFTNREGEKLLNDNWKQIMGPALCVYNDASFTQEDMQGIQNLGQGSKEDDLLKTGKYGVGFNAVYNLTDTPCFWTRVDGEKEKEKICVLDPNFFVAGRRRLPGIRLKVDDRFQSEYPDMLAPFVVNGQGNTKNQSGTVFRLPVRTRGGAKRSKIRQDAMDPRHLERLLREFQPKMGECLLFLNNVKKVGVYSIQQDGTLHREYETQLTTDKRSAILRKDFNEHVKDEAGKLKTEGQGHSLTKFRPREVAVHTELSDTLGKKEEWLVVSKFGMTETDASFKTQAQSRDIHKHRLLPLAGVALCISGRGDSAPATQGEWGKHAGKTESTAANQEKTEFQAYCVLPLPVDTGLPVHVNARFALDHETRRNIETKRNTLLAEWNRLLARRLIVPAYIKALHEVKATLFSEEQKSLTPERQDEQGDNLRGRTEATGPGKKRRNVSPALRSRKKAKIATVGDHGDYSSLERKLSIFNSFFPDVSDNVDAFWRSLVQELYKQLAQNEADVFPVVREDLQRLLFVPAVRSQGFPGFFWDDSKKVKKSLKNILLRLNMNIIESPCRIYIAFLHSKVGGVRCVDEQAVIQFLSSCQQEASEPDSSCNLKDLPKRVEDTSFQTAKNVKEVFEFISGEVSSLDCLPLSLRVSGKLYLFGSSTPTIVSYFADLLPGSSDRFLLTDLIQFAQRHGGKYTQGILENLSISRLASLLPHSLDKRFGSGKVCKLADAADADFQLPSVRWIRRFWEFLKEELSYHSANRESVDQYIQYLSDWSFIPVCSDESVLLFPLQDRDLVVYIHERPHLMHTPTSGSSDVAERERDTLESLKKLPLNRLDLKSLPGNSIATEIVASVARPHALLIALARADITETAFGSRDAETILSYFQRHFPQVHWTEITSIRSLPFFETPDGRLISVPAHGTPLCLPGTVPTTGLTDWVANTQVILLKENRNLTGLYSQLNFQTPNVSDFYTQYLVPAVRHLPAEAILVHMEYVKDHVLPNTTLSTASTRSALIETLRQTAFIKGVDGTLCKASTFYSPYLDVFKVMLTSDVFPPPPYNSVKWRGFLERIGMICEVSAERFLTFAEQVEDRGKTGVTEKVKQQSTVLCKYFFRTSGLQGSTYLLEKLKTCQFLLPKQVSDLENGKILETIHHPFPPPTPLLTFADGCSPSDAHLVWTSKALLDESADPVTQGFPNHLYQHIGFTGKPPEDVVMKHAKNVCLALRKKGRSRNDSLFFQQHLNLIESFMEKFYKALAFYKDESLQSFRDIPVIFHRNEMAMFLSDQVVITLAKEQTVKGHVVRAPQKFGKFFELFQRLGVSEEPRADHYAKALERLHEESQGRILEPNELELVKGSVDNLFTRLKAEHGSDKTLSVKSVYLPAESITEVKDTQNTLMSVYLADSRQLILEVTDEQKNRVRSPSEHLAVFLSFKKLELEARDLHREVNGRLPDAYKMKLWQEVVKETLTESCKTLARADTDTLFFEGRMHSPEVINAVLRLVNHQKLKEDQEFPEDAVKEVEEKLHSLRIRKVTNLETVLSMNGCELLGTKEKTDFFLEQQPQVEQGVCNATATLYADCDQNLSQDCGNKEFMLKLNAAVRLVVGTMDGMLLDYCLQKPSAAATFLNKNNVPAFYISRETQPTVFPAPGTFVPESMHDLLDNVIYEFHVGEHVAYELFDPCLDIGESKDTDDTDREEQRRPVYIFAKVVSVIDQCDPELDLRTKLLRMRYTIEIGEEKTKEVGACELYKFVRTRHSDTSTSTAVAPYTGEPASALSAFLETNVDDDLAKVLKDIRRQLRDIWSAFASDKDRLRAVKRLLLKWHPDKNQGREEFCTKVFQRIQHYVDLLKQGRDLPTEDDIDEDTVDSAGFTYHPPSRQHHGHRPRRRRYHNDGGGWYGSFFSAMFDRGRTYATSSSTSSGSTRYDSGTSGSSDFFRTSTSNPQPEEGRRWMRQAKLDLDAAVKTLRGGDALMYNWACYQAHQTAEKALKAVAFRRDAWACRKTSHSLRELAGSLSDSEITEHAGQLDDLVQYHTRMRYPDLCTFPKIPAEVYGQDEATKATSQSSLTNTTRAKRGPSVYIEHVPEPKQPRVTYSSSSSGSCSSNTG